MKKFHFFITYLTLPLDHNTDSDVDVRLTNDHSEGMYIDDFA